ncbi:hypothetical protein BC567DRAFT_238562 [Phyllosticta citribraziliensis]
MFLKSEISSSSVHGSLRISRAAADACAVFGVLAACAEVRFATASFPDGLLGVAVLAFAVEVDVEGLARFLGGIAVRWRATRFRLRGVSLWGRGGLSI